MSEQPVTSARAHVVVLETLAKVASGEGFTGRASRDAQDSILIEVEQGNVATKVLFDSRDALTEEGVRAHVEQVVESIRRRSADSTDG